MNWHIFNTIIQGRRKFQIPALVLIFLFTIILVGTVAYGEPVLSITDWESGKVYEKIAVQPGDRIFRLDSFPGENPMERILLCR